MLPSDVPRNVLVQDTLYTHTSTRTGRVSQTSPTELRPDRQDDRPTEELCCAVMGLGLDMEHGTCHGHHLGRYAALEAIQLRREPCHGLNVLKRGYYWEALSMFRPRATDRSGRPHTSPSPSPPPSHCISPTTALLLLLLLLLMTLLKLFSWPFTVAPFIFLFPFVIFSDFRMTLAWFGPFIPLLLLLLLLD